MKTYTIYAFTNKINNKIYVGLTSTSVKKRWGEHVKKAKYKCKNSNGNYFQRAIVKYGKEGWSSKILDKCNSLKEAEKAEIKWINYYQSNKKEFGYNLTSGGNVSQSPLDPRVIDKISKSITKIMSDPKIRNKHSKFMKRWHREHTNPFQGKKHTKKTCDLLRQATKKWHQENDNPFKGKTHTEESRKKMSAAAKKRCADPNWQPPLVKNGVSKETREKMRQAALKRERKSKIANKEKLLEVAKTCKTQKEMAVKLNCTPAAISYLIKKFNIKSQIKNLLHYST